MADIIDFEAKQRTRKIEKKLMEAWDTMHITKIAFFVQELEKVETAEDYARVLEQFGFSIDE